MRKLSKKTKIIILVGGIIVVICVALLVVIFMYGVGEWTDNSDAGCEVELVEGYANKPNTIKFLSDGSGKAEASADFIERATTTIEFDVIYESVSGYGVLEIYSGSDKVVTVSLMDDREHVVWYEIKLVVDCNKDTYKFYVDGDEEESEDLIKNVEDVDSITLSYRKTTGKESSMYISWNGISMW
jgi:hypothetical protein